MIIDYEAKYDEQVKNLLVELQQYLVNLDKEHFNIITEEYKEAYFNKTIESVKNNSGKILLYEEDNEIMGLVVGIVNNEETLEYDFCAPKRGRITELIVSKKYRGKNIGKKLLHSMKKYLKSIGCKNIMIAVFGYNTNAIKFYEENGFHIRMLDMIKKKKKINETC